MHFWGQHFWFSNVSSFHKMLCFNSCSTFRPVQNLIFYQSSIQIFNFVFLLDHNLDRGKSEITIFGSQSWQLDDCPFNPSQIKVWPVSDFRFFNFYFLLDHNFDWDLSEIGMFGVVVLTAGWFKPFQIQLLTGLQLRLHPFCVF